MNPLPIEKRTNPSDLQRMFNITKGVFKESLSTAQLLNGVHLALSGLTTHWEALNLGDVFAENIKNSVEQKFPPLVNSVFPPTLTQDQRARLQELITSLEEGTAPEDELDQFWVSQILSNIAPIYMEIAGIFEQSVHDAIPDTARHPYIVGCTRILANRLSFITQTLTHILTDYYNDSEELPATYLVLPQEQGENAYHRYPSHSIKLNGWVAKDQRCIEAAELLGLHLPLVPVCRITLVDSEGTDRIQWEVPVQSVLELDLTPVGVLVDAINTKTGGAEVVKKIVASGVKFSQVRIEAENIPAFYEMETFSNYPPMSEIFSGGFDEYSDSQGLHYMKFKQTVSVQI
jgi:hypothetical protein